MIMPRWAPAFAGAVTARAPLAALTCVRPATVLTCRAGVAPRVARSLVTAPARWAAATAGDVLPDLPGAGSEPGGEVGWLYDRYATEGAAGGITDFGSAPTYSKQREAPLPEVHMSNHSKHALRISRHKLNDICRTIRGLSAHVSPPASYCGLASCALRGSSSDLGGAAGGGRPALLLAKARGG